MRWTDNDVIVPTNDPEEDFRGVPSAAYDIAAAVTISHPYIMAGSGDEVLIELCRIAVKVVQEDGHVVTNVYGVKFWEA